MKHVLLEVCIESVDDAVTAVAAGADRLELNSALGLGGITPSLGTLIEIRRQIGRDVPIVVMVRPREGDFCYSSKELDVMHRDIEHFLAHGASGIALGLLTAEGRVDSPRCRPFVEQVRSQSAASEGVVFHRAFDFTVDPLAAIDDIAELGFRRILTSGQCRTAGQGAGQIARYIAHAAGRIEILPAAGIRPENVVALIRDSGCEQVHGSLREPVVESGECAIVDPTQVQLASGPHADHSQRTATSGRLIREMLARLGRG